MNQNKSQATAVPLLASSLGPHLHLHADPRLSPTHGEQQRGGIPRLAAQTWVQGPLHPSRVTLAAASSVTGWLLLIS